MQRLSPLHNILAHSFSRLLCYMDCAAYRDCLSLLMFLSEYLLYAFGAVGAKRHGAAEFARMAEASYDSIQLGRPKGDRDAISDHDHGDLLSAAR